MLIFEQAATDETAEPILTRSRPISKRVSHPQEVSTFGGQNNNFTILGVKISKTPQNWPE